MSGKYFVLEETHCENCEGTGYKISTAYHKVTRQELARNHICIECKGKGVIYEPVSLDINILREINDA